MLTLDHEQYTEKKGPLLGDFVYKPSLFKEGKARLDLLIEEGILELGIIERKERLHRLLLQLIQTADHESFLLAAVVNFISMAIEKKILDGTYTFNHFELWLIHASGVNKEEEELVRAKIAGRYLPRQSYQRFFPIGMGRSYRGTHFVTGHHPPDLDTSVASFWGWMDAFSARVTCGLHVWNLPGNDLPESVRHLFDPLFGSGLLRFVPRKDATLKVTGKDLISHHPLVQESPEARTYEIGKHLEDRLVILSDSQGFYLGSWRGSDMENHRLVATLVNSCWRWLESMVYTQLIALFARPDVRRQDVQTFAQTLLGIKIVECSLVRELAEGQKQLLQQALVEIFGLEQGLQATFEQLTVMASKRGMGEFKEVKRGLEELLGGSLFDRSGKLIEDRPRLFRELQAVLQALDRALVSCRDTFDRLGIAIAVKRKVLMQRPQYVSSRCELEEIELTMGSLRFLTVVEPEEEKRLIPIGAIDAADLRRKPLGTVTLRDFCNRDEVKIPSYLEIISVVDHHRASLQTHSAPLVLMADVQSCNVLLAEQSLLMNEEYAVCAKEPSFSLEEDSLSSMRMAQKILQRKIAKATRGPYFVHPDREYVEYLSYLYAILDDTDLLERVTARDVLCVAHLLNRLKSILVGEEVEIISLDDIERDSSFAKVAARRILEQEDMYSLYRKIYAQREESVQADLMHCLEGKSSSIFADTKEQKGCARVGQTKIFVNNVAQFFQHVQTFRRVWLGQVREIDQHRSNIQLHLQMISTLAGAEEVHRGKNRLYSHLDEIWIWIPDSQEAQDYLGSYLSAFRNAPEVANNSLSVELLGPNVQRLKTPFIHHFRDVSIEMGNEKALPACLAVIRFNAGTITSRKMSITPYLPSVSL